MVPWHDDDDDDDASKDKRPKKPPNKNNNAILEAREKPFMPSSTNARGKSVSDADTLFPCPQVTKV